MASLKVFKINLKILIKFGLNLKKIQVFQILYFLFPINKMLFL